MSLLLLFGGGAGAPASTGPSYTIEAGLGGSFRQTLVNEEHIVACWPLAEVASGSARNIVRNRLHGTYTGGPARGVSLGLPEGGMGVTFTGADYVEVPDDSADALLLNMSLASGDFDAYFLFSTSTNDGTLRCIVHKQTSGSASNGWYCAFQNGALKGFLRVAGVTIFTVTSASGLADGQIHLAHLNYRASSNTAQWYVDGGASGSSAAGSTEPAVVGGALRIGMFNDGAGGFIGTIGYVTIGREGNASLSATLQTQRDWTDLTEDVRLTRGINVRYGIPGTGPNDRVANIGSLIFALDNSPRNSGSQQSWYSPGHASARSGFDLSIPIRFSVTFNGTTYYKFRGVVKDVQPIAGVNETQEVLVTCVDWMDVAADTMLTGVEPLISQESWLVWGRMVDAADRAPVSVVFWSNDTDVFPYALDNSRSEEMPALTEFQRIAQSDFNKTVIRGDTATGGVLSYYDRVTLQSLISVAQFDNSMNDLEFVYARDSIINRARATYYPRTVGGSPVDLFVLESPRTVKAGEMIEIEGPYTDPNEAGAVRIGRTNAATTPTVAVNTASDGSGTDITADCEIVTDAGANQVRFTVTNHSAFDGYVTQAELAGTPIYFYDPETVPYSDGDSIRRHGIRGRGTGDIDMVYQATGENAEAAARHVVVSRANPLSNVRSLSFVADRSEALMTQALSREPMDRIDVRETMVTGSAYVTFDIHEVQYSVDENGFLTTTWALAPVNDIGGWWKLGVSQLSVDTRLAWG